MAKDTQDEVAQTDASAEVPATPTAGPARGQHYQEAPHENPFMPKRVAEVVDVKANLASISWVKYQVVKANDLPEPFEYATSADFLAAFPNLLPQ